MAASTWRTWAGTYRGSATTVIRPASTAEAADLVRAAASNGRRIKAVGSGHSFTDIAATDDVRIDLRDLSGPLAVDLAGRLVTVGAGTTLRDLNTLLAQLGLALPNLGDIDAQTIAGAISTGTHGTGAGYGCLSTFVAALTLVTGSGEVVHCSAETRPDLFAAARVGLGALGVITEVTLHCVDAFVLHADERPARLAEVLADCAEHVASNDHAEFYWFPYTDLVQLKRNNRVSADDRPLPRWRRVLDDQLLANTVFGAACRIGRTAPRAIPMISAVAARALTARAYTARSDRVFCTPRRVRFTEMEYGLPRAALPEAFAALRAIVASLPDRVLFPVEVRFTAADDIWLSHGYGRDSAYVAIHQYVGMAYEPYFRAFEQVCAGLGGRPHWGKLHWRDAESLAAVYPRFVDFQAMRDRLDPDRVFTNPYLTRVLGP